MSDLQQWADGRSSIVPSRDERQHQKAVSKLVRDTRLTGLRVDAEAALTGKIMERAVDIDNYRKQLANGDPVLDAVLTRIEVGFVAKVERIQHNFGSEFPL